MFLATLLFATGRRRRPITLRISGPRGPLRFTVPDYAAMRVLGEVFVKREYAIELDSPPATVVDLGASTGASSLFFRCRYPEARIVAVEASPALVELLRSNTSELDVEVRHAAVAPAAGTATFFEADESWAGSTTIRVGTPVEVPAITLDELLDKPVDLVKMDLEGAEFDVLPAARRLTQMRALICELHAAPGTAASRRVLDRLDGFEVSIDVEHSDPFTLFTAVRRGA